LLGSFFYIHIFRFSIFLLIVILHFSVFLNVLFFSFLAALPVFLTNSEYRQWRRYTRSRLVKWHGWKANDLPVDLAVAQ